LSDFFWFCLIFKFVKRSRMSFGPKHVACCQHNIFFAVNFVFAFDERRGASCDESAKSAALICSFTAEPSVYSTQQLTVKCKGKGHPRTGHDSFLTTAQDGGR
jgi:hypothetical protein